MSKKLKLKGKVLVLMVSLLILLSASIISASYFEIKSLARKSLDNSLNGYIKLSFDLLEHKYYGEWSVEGDKLYKGSTVLNDNTEFVDSVKEATGSPVTIFLGDTRIATSVLKDGKRVIGTKAADNVVSRVLKDGKEFTGDATVIDSLYQSKYVPLKDSSGNIVGMLFIGVSKSASSAQINNLILVIGLISIIALSISIIIFTQFTNGIIKNIKKILTSLNKISAGDLTEVCEVKSSDETKEIADSINNMCEGISHLVYGMKQSSIKLQHDADNLSSLSIQMSASTEEVSTAISQVASGTGTQAGDLIGVTSALNSFGDGIDKIAHAVNEIDTNSKSINSMAATSDKDMNYLIESINTMSSTFNMFMDKLSLLGENVTKINEITNLINSVADQTNLLALNAAIEAARAGETGRGFAIVADEIRKLAEQSKTSSQNINSIVSTISGDSKEIINSAGIMNTELLNQVNIINVTIDSFKKIVASVNKVIPMIEAVNTSTTMINNDKYSIIGNVETISSISEEVSASAEEIAASSEEITASSQEVTVTAQNLRTMTIDMSNQVNKFKIKE